jgi:hypothetical protein
MSRVLTGAALTLVAVLLCAAAPPSSGPASLKSAFGNTIVSTYPDGRTAKLWLQPGGVYTAQGRRGDPSNGKWNVKGGKLCLKQSHPVIPFFSYCTPIPAGGLHATWTAKAVTGETVRVKLVEGRRPSRARRAPSA